MSKIKDIVIVGGGTAGWSAAAILSASPDVNVTIVEPSDIPTIGVGESTLPFLNFAHYRMGFECFKDKSWLDRVDGTIKFTIEFANFNKQNEKWIHPFAVPAGLNDRLTIEKICSAEISDRIYQSQENFVSKNFILASYKEEGFKDTEFYLNNDYINDYIGYHINAELYAKLLKEETVKRSNVKLIDSSVKKIKSSDSSVNEIELENGDKLNAEVFVDCTGFKALLASETNSQWISFSDTLKVDTALAVQLPYANEDLQKRNATYCHALDNGWVWSVPLQTRVGTGYIYSSEFTSEEAATEEFKNHLEERYGYDTADLTFRKVPFKVGYRPQSWKNNVVAIGLSSFFLEPLESTAIATMHYQIARLHDLINDDTLEFDTKVKVFNEDSASYVLGVKSFIELHYKLSKRDDSDFWKYVSTLELTQEQKNVISLFTEPSRNFNRETVKAAAEKGNIFDFYSFAVLLLGYDIKPNNKEQWIKDRLS